MTYETDCPLADLLDELRSGGLPPLAWAVRYAPDGGDPMASVWANARDMYAMWDVLRLCRRVPWGQGAGVYPDWYRALRCERANAYFVHLDESASVDYPDEEMCRIDLDSFDECLDCCAATRAAHPTPPTLAELAQAIAEED